jgi:Zn-finger nucleic acid-binding protein
MTLTCPKCSSEMKSYERNRILVDQCTGCGGLFLDKGELEQLVAAETAWHVAQSVAPAPARQSNHDDRPRYDRPRYDDRDDRDDRRDDRDYKPRKKKSSFLSDLFEG